METRRVTENAGMGAMLRMVAAAMKLVAEQEIMPRYMKVAHQHKIDGSL